MPIALDLAVVAVGLGSLLLLRLAGGAMPWGHLLIAVGPDGRPLRPRVRWQLWSISRGEPPRQAALMGLASVLLGFLSLWVVAPRLAVTVVRPIGVPVTMAPPVAAGLTFLMALAFVLMPFGLVVFIRAGMDIASRHSNMSGIVVGMRRDVGVFGHAYHIAVQPGDRAMARGLWAESFKVDQATFKRLSPGDRVRMEYSPRLRYVYATVEAERRIVA